MRKFLLLLVFLAACAQTMELSSTAFIADGSILAKYTCDGDNVNPPLQISDVPIEAKSLILIVDDPDAPRGDWVHWLIWNMDPKITEITENSVPAGAVQGLTDFGSNEWGGPCPPSGTHRYYFKLYALDTLFELPLATTKVQLEAAMQGHILEQTQLLGTYQRQ